MIYRIFFERRAIVICSPDDNVLQDPDGVVLFNSDNNKLNEIIEEFINSDKISTLYIASEEIEKTYSEFCSLFTEINAGGGVVCNSCGEFLLIYRNEIWDLPKGKQEPGEEIALTAIREVQEECGTINISIGKKICITNHTYHRNGHFILKHTHWFEMSDSLKESLHPQKEEDITNAKWVPKNELRMYLKETYPSILEVFGHIL